MGLLYLYLYLQSSQIDILNLELKTYFQMCSKCRKSEEFKAEIAGKCDCQHVLCFQCQNTWMMEIQPFPVECPGFPYIQLPKNLQDWERSSLPRCLEPL